MAACYGPGLRLGVSCGRAGWLFGGKGAAGLRVLIRADRNGLWKQSAKAGMV